MVSPVWVPVLWLLGFVSLVSIALFFRLLRSGFELRRANLFLRFGMWEPYFLVVSLSLVAMIGLEFACLALWPDAIDLFPDVMVLLLVHTAAVVVYFRIFLLLREFKVEG
ncbi:MAG: hypothetical protein QXO51_07235 [Halobacteria archaeon]